MIQPLWKTIFPFLTKLNLYLSCHPGITLLNMRNETYAHRLVHDMYVANLFIIAKNWKLSECHQWC